MAWWTGIDDVPAVAPRLLYRVSFHEEHAYTLPEMGACFTGLDRLVWVLALGAAGESATARAWFATNDTWERMSATADRIALNTQVSQVRRESPLEVILAVTVAGSAGVAFGSRLLTLFSRYQDARLKKARTDLQVVALEVINEAITGRKTGLRPLKGQAGRQRESDLRAAADALAAIDKLEELLPRE